MSTANDGSESVDQFLARIASVQEGRDEADEQRKRRMEEEFLKNRTERQARRLERARSLSPSKTGPLRPTPLQSTPAPLRETGINPPVDFSPRNSTLSRSNAVRTSPTLEPIRVENGQSSPPSAKTAPLSRSGTLSWQQRPSSKDGSLGSPRPLSTTVMARPKQGDSQSGSSRPKEQSRSEIAAALGQKDPAWFRQTQDRGLSSAAYRKNHVEDTPKADASIRSMRLPGLSREGQQSQQEQSPNSRSPALSDKLQGRDGTVSPLPSSSSALSEVEPGLQQRHTPAGHAVQDSSLVADKPFSRSSSPTKGLGGFVQSAMMRRSDSVSKRWTVQAGGGLQRGDSIASARPRSGILATGRTSPVKPRPTSPIADASDSAVSSPQQGPSKNLSQAQSTLNSDIVNSQNANTVQSSSDQNRPITPPDRNNLSRSPSKAQESRRWSPTKSSWLESTLLAKQDLPKLSPKKEEQPQWMVSLQRSKSKKDLPLKKNETDPEPSKESEIQETQTSDLVDDIGGQALSPGQLSKKSKTVQRLTVMNDTMEDKSILTSKETKTAKDQHGLSADPGDSLTAAAKRPLPELKPKPQTPPKTDFRASLRSRTTIENAERGTEPEFKSVFGKLKPAQTKNYVAPDTFKENILSGKAALNLTGGPQKSQRVDEFKESILQKKQAMKASADERQANPSPGETKKPYSPLPEALQRRKTLHRATPSAAKAQHELQGQNSISQSSFKPTPAPKSNNAIATKESSGRNIDSEIPPAKLSNPTSLTENVVKASTRDTHDPRSPDLTSKPAESNGKLGAMTARSIAPSQATKIESPIRSSTQEGDVQVSPKATAVISDNISSTEAKPGLPAGSKLASRLNPNLAALISRGNLPRQGSDDSSPSETTTSRQQMLAQPSAQDTSKKEAAPTAELTHMTKGRAKGPRRRAPKTQTAPSEPKLASTDSKPSKVQLQSPSSLVSSPPSPTKSIRDIQKVFSSTELSSEEDPQKTSSAASTEPNTLKGRENSDLGITDKTATRAKPSVAMKSPDLRKVSNPTVSKLTEASPPKPATIGAFEIVMDKTPRSESPKKMISPVRPAETPERTQSPKPLTPSTSKVNTIKQPAPEKPTKSPSIKASGFRSTATPPLGKAAADAPSKEGEPQKASNTSTSASQSPISETVLQFFGSNLPTTKDKAEFDTQTLLEGSTKEIDKSKTIGNSIWELNGDGKKTPMPPQQEHILYEDCMYLMVHTFESNGSKQTEVFLWSGDRVPDAAVEDVQIFCRKDAREQNAKLELIKQGKEPSRFFQALGGIVIIRRSKVSALYMLCGRKHLGHIAFDEVDLAVRSLCSGFPYLISAKFGNLYLWKGKGSAADEVGCARLIGMDLGLTGEMEEIDEGQEPASFWDAFADPSTKRVISSAWQQRNDHAAYPCSLYRIEHERPKSAGGFWGLRSASPPKTACKAAIESLEPFTQRDLEPGNVYVLDAHHAVYVLLDAKSTSKSAECATALHLAQEIAMLSPSIQRRSLLPLCFVVFGDPPNEVSNCFRKWTVRDGKSSGPSTCLRLEDVMQALGL